MGPTEIKAWSDALGPTLIAVIALVMVVLPMLKRNKTEQPHADISTAVKLENHEGRIVALEKRVK